MILINLSTKTIIAVRVFQTSIRVYTCNFHSTITDQAADLRRDGKC